MDCTEYTAENLLLPFFTWTLPTLKNFCVFSNKYKSLICNSVLNFGIIYQNCFPLILLLKVNIKEESPSAKPVIQ